MHKIFSGAEEVANINTECRRAGIGCVDCKKLLARNMNASLEPFRACREELNQTPDRIWDVLRDGANRARAIAEQTMVDVREAIGLAK
jgi:tryptophanyl-tRNA synthetase